MVRTGKSVEIERANWCLREAQWKREGRVCYGTLDFFHGSALELMVMVIQFYKDTKSYMFCCYCCWVLFVCLFAFCFYFSRQCFSGSPGTQYTRLASNSQKSACLYLPSAGSHHHSFFCLVLFFHFNFLF